MEEAASLMMTQEDNPSLAFLPWVDMLGIDRSTRGVHVPWLAGTGWAPTANSCHQILVISYAIETVLRHGSGGVAASNWSLPSAPLSPYLPPSPPSPP